MSEFDKYNPSADNLSTDDVLADLEALSKKYGLDFDADKFRKPSAASQYSPLSTTTNTNYNPPKNNRPARTSRIVFDESSAAGVKVVYQDYQSTPLGPQGRRVVYQEQETESIIEKRRRNAALQAARITNQKPVASVSESAKKPETVKITEQKTDETVKPIEFTETDDNNIDALISDDSLFSIDNSSGTEEKPKTKKVHRHYEVSKKEKTARFFKSFIPWKGDSAKEVFRKLTMNVSAIVMLVCIGMFVNNYIEHREQLQNLENLDQLKQTEVATDNLEEKWAAIKAKYPDVQFPEGMNIEYAEIYAQNQDFVGWLHIDNTNIDTAIVHRPSDRNTSAQDYYLKRNFFGTSDKYGNPYLDKYNTGSELDQNNIIHGHNMTDGLSFAQLEKYYTIDGFKESPVIEYNTLYGNYKFKVYAVIITNGTSAGDNGYLFSYITAHFPTDENFEGFIQAIDERKLYDTGVDINKDDTLITLSTCSYEIKKTQMGRLAVIGRLVRDGESADVDTSLAVKNENVRYPQIWYDEHNMTNPYKDAYRWKAE